jgi:hypothetical protein
VFLFPTLKLIGPCRNADFVGHSFFPETWRKGQLPCARGTVVALAARSVLARQKNHFIREIELDLGEGKIREWDRLGINDIAVPIITS